MSTSGRKIIIEEGRCVFCSVPTKKVHHLDFPEIWAESGSLADAIAHLSGQLALYRDGAQSDFHRELIEVALADLAVYKQRPAEATPGRELCCRCAPGPIAVVRPKTSAPMKIPPRRTKA